MQSAAQRRNGNGKGDGSGAKPRAGRFPWCAVKRQRGAGDGQGWSTGDRTLHLYLRRISAIPLIPREEERRLAELANRGDQPARDRLIEANLRFVVKVALHYQGCGLSILDLIEEGNLGLTAAARRFSPAHGVRFITYAAWWIRRAIVEALARSGGPVRLPARKARLAWRIGRWPWPSPPGAGGGPDLERLAGDLAEDRADLEAILRARTPTVSFDEGPNVADRLVPLAAGDPAPEEPWLAEDRRTALARAVGGLPPREGEVLRLRFGLEGEPMTLDEIGRRFGLSRERIRQIERAAAGRLRHDPATRELFFP
jgi:RNA polymerase primary sigma factor